MKASAARDIVLAHAIETSAPNEALPDAQRIALITQQSLQGMGEVATEGGAGRKSFEKFLQLRAGRIIGASQLPAAVRQVLQRSASLSRLTVLGVAAAALLLGFAGHAITDPHRVDLLSPALIGIVLWNLLVYVLLVAMALRGLIKRRPRNQTLLQATDAAAASANLNASAEAVAGPGWWRRLAGRRLSLGRGLAGGMGGDLRKTVLQFERNWWQLQQRSRRSQWLACLHLGAALLALGALASLWTTGLWRAYLVGWESTFLSPEAVHRLLNLLFAPVQWLFGLAPWSLTDIEALQGWVEVGGANHSTALTAAQATGRHWVQAYSLLLGLLVVLPRLLLALWQGLRARWLANHIELPLQQAYFQNLRCDHGGVATLLAMMAYSLERTPAREEALQHYAAQHYGAGVRLHWQAPVEYGAELPLQMQPADAQPVLLLNLAATPEAEIHGQLLAQLHARWGAQTPVWLWCRDFMERNAAAPERVRERRALWQQFVESAGLTVQWVAEKA